MKIVYSCYGGAHSSQVAAAIHLGLLPVDRIPRPDEILALPRFDRVTDEERGVVEYAGKDEEGHEVYVMGRGPGLQVVERAFRSGFWVGGGEPDQLLFVNTLTTVNLAMRVGGYLSRRLGFVFLGRPIVTYGTRLAYPNLVRLVQRIRQEAGRSTIL